MSSTSEDPLSDKERLLFGAGFVFGVMFTMLILAVVIATVGGNTGTGVEAMNVFVTVSAGIFFAGVVGVALYFLAFPENRVEIPIGDRLADVGNEQADRLADVANEQAGDNGEQDDR